MGEPMVDMINERCTANASHCTNGRSRLSVAVRQGLTAAIAAGRLGARTMIVERYGSLGGVLTQVGVESFAWYRHPGTEDCEGICREYEGRARALGFTRPEPQSISEVIDTEGFKVVADQMITEAGVEPLYRTPGTWM